MILRVIGDASCDFLTRILPLDVQKLLIFLDFLSSSKRFYYSVVKGGKILSYECSITVAF